MKAKALLLTFLLTSIFLSQIASAISITVSTNKGAYKRGETVKVTGKISGASSYPVSFTWEAKDSTGRRIDFDQATTDSSGKFSFSFVIKSSTSLGKAVVTISYGGVTGSAAFYIKESSSLSLSANPKSVTKGGKVTLTGSLNPKLQGISIKILQSSGGGWSQIATVKTDSNGRFSYTWSANTEGTYSFKATWNGNDKYFGSTSNTVSVKVVKPSKPKGRLTISANATRLLPGQVVEIQGKLEPAKDTKIYLFYTTPIGDNLKFEVEVKKGLLSHTLRLDIEGEWRVKALWPGDHEYASTQSNVLKIVVERKHSNLTLNIYPSKPEIFASVTINGSLYPPLENQTLSLIIENSQETIRREIVTEEAGFYEYTFEVNVSGVWTVSVFWNGTELYKQCMVNTTFTVFKKHSQLTLFFDPPVGVKGEKVEIYGFLTPPLENEEITIKMSINSGKTWTKVVELRTGENGKYSFTWTPQVSSCLLSAEWKGNDAYAGTSTTRLFEIVESLKKAEVEAEGIKAKIFFISNISIIDFKLEKGMLSARLSGASSGHLKIYIDKAIYEIYNASPQSSILLLSRQSYSAFNITDAGKYYKAEILISDVSGDFEVYLIIAAWNVDVEVVDSKENPLSQAYILLTGVTLPLNYSARSDLNGIATFTGIPPGEYKVEVIYWGAKVGEQTILVDGNLKTKIITKVGYWEMKYEELSSKYSQLEEEYKTLLSEHQSLEEKYSELVETSYQLAMAIATLVFLSVFLTLYTIFRERKIFFG
ncbi:MAG: hypothetical protein DRJ38_03695 [Thermoprotei archaeon]|nr:MAG: hypothetical protein DRJ38_03695 [Thermoprotei archaeon]